MSGQFPLMDRHPKSVVWTIPVRQTIAGINCLDNSNKIDNCLNQLPAQFQLKDSRQNQLQTQWSIEIGMFQGVTYAWVVWVYDAQTCGMFCYTVVLLKIYNSWVLLNATILFGYDNSPRSCFLQQNCCDQSMCYLRVPFHQLASPSGFHATHIPIGTLFYILHQNTALRAVITASYYR